MDSYTNILFDQGAILLSGFDGPHDVNKEFLQIDISTVLRQSSVTLTS